MSEEKVNEPGENESPKKTEQMDQKPKEEIDKKLKDHVEEGTDQKHENDGNDPKSSKLKDGDDEMNQEKDEAKKSPKGIYFILGNEFCERFSFYGMRTVLTLFLVHQLKLGDNVATQIYHGFDVLCYCTPLFGAILADSWLGRFRTIFYLSILYAIGNVIISVGAVPGDLLKMKVLTFIGLIIIGLGTGGIKPCVSAFGGDQFSSSQEEKRKYFFSLFYFSINLGSFLSTAITPALRGDVHCFGQDTCFSLAFFVPAVLFVLALILFIIGKRFYLMKPIEGSVFISVFKCIWYALVQKVTSKKEKKQHWLEYAEDKYDKDLIQDVKSLLNVLIIFIPIPLFWALFEQQGSKWVLQSTRMNGEIYGSFIKPDHMQLVNPIFILVLIPIYDNVIYPIAAKCKLCRTSLQRMTIGGLLCALSFVVAAIIQFKIENDLPSIPSTGHSDLTIINNTPCSLNIESSANITLRQFESETVKENVIQKSAKWRFTPTGCSANTSVAHDLNATSMYEIMMVTLENDHLKFDVSEDSRTKDKIGYSRIRLLFSLDYQFTKNEDASFLFQGSSSLYLSPKNMTLPGGKGMTDYYSAKPSRYKLYLPSNGTNSQAAVPFGEISLKSGGSYIIYIYQNRSTNKKEFRHTITVVPSSVHILWQIPQGIIITCGEVMLSITGLEFSYSQAPSSLKSIIQAAWLLTSAIGNFLVVILVQYIKIGKQSYEFLMYAALMTLSMFVLGILAHYYKYVNDKKNLE